MKFDSESLKAYQFHEFFKASPFLTGILSVSPQHGHLSGYLITLVTKLVDLIKGQYHMHDTHTDTCKCTVTMYVVWIIDTI